MSCVTPFWPSSQPHDTSGKESDRLGEVVYLLQLKAFHPSAMGKRIANKIWNICNDLLLIKYQWPGEKVERGRPFMSRGPIDHPLSFPNRQLLILNFLNVVCPIGVVSLSPQSPSWIVWGWNRVDIQLEVFECLPWIPVLFSDSLVPLSTWAFRSSKRPLHWGKNWESTGPVHGIF